MDFYGFTNRDFDFFKKKDSMPKEDYEIKKNEVKTNFRGFCYQIQKKYYSETKNVLNLDKNFKGLAKNKNYIYTDTIYEDKDLGFLNIFLCQDYLSISFIIEINKNKEKYDKILNIFKNKKELFLKFLKEDKHFYIVLNKDSKKTIESEEIKFENNQLINNQYDLLIENIERNKNTASDKLNMSVHIKLKYSKGEAMKIGKNLLLRANTDVIKLMNLALLIIEE